MAETPPEVMPSEEGPSQELALFRPYSDQAALEEFQDFYQFYLDIIRPYEPRQFKNLSDFHLQLMLASCYPLCAEAAPRNHIKSTIFSRYRPLYRLVKNTTRSGLPVEIALISETTSLAQAHLKWIKKNLTDNPHLLAAYGDLTDTQAHTWNEEEVELVTGAALRTYGYGSQFRGKHPSDIIVDDLESEKNVLSEETLRKLKDWFYRVIIGAMDPEAGGEETNLAVIGTIIVKNSLLQELAALPEFHGRVWKSLTACPPEIHPSGLRALWPERWPVEALLKRKRLIGTHRFEAEYQNNPIGLTDQIILPEWIRRYDPSTSQLKPIRTYIACDPAFTEERWGDYSAIIVLHETSDGRLYERLAWRGKVNLPTLIKTLMDFYYHFRHDGDIRMGIEEVAAQKGIRQAITAADPSIEITPLRPDKDKVRRLAAVSQHFEFGTVHLATERLIDELLQFPHGSKDSVDALVWALKLYENEHPVIRVADAEEINPLTKLDDTSLAAYMDASIEGKNGQLPPSKLVDEYYRAQWISDSLDGLM